MHERQRQLVSSFVWYTYTGTLTAVSIYNSIGVVFL